MANVSTSTPDQPLARPSAAELNRLLATLEVKVVRLTECLVSQGWRLEVTGRLGAHGEELEPVDLEALPAVPGGVEEVAVCLLHADLEPGHERAVAEALRRQGHDVTCSHEVSPEMREYERTVTTVVNASLRPRCRAYLRGLAETSSHQRREGAENQNNSNHTPPTTIERAIGSAQPLSQVL